MRKILMPLFLGASLTLPAIVWAEDAALVVVQSDYENLPDAPGASQAVMLSEALEEAGFRVSSTLDQGSDAVREAVEAFREDAQDADRLLVYLSGHMVSGARDGYLLTHEAGRPTSVSIGGESLAIGPIMDLLATRPGQALLLTAQVEDDVAGDGLTDGVTPTAAQGVTIVSGPAARLTRKVVRDVLDPGLPLGVALEDLPRDVTASGFLSTAVPYLPPEDGDVVVIQREPDPETAFWVVAEQLGTRQGYELYLDNFADGEHADAARAGLATLEEEAVNEDAEAEAALALNREARRQIQRNLALLGHDPRGIDGIFGPATRAAITSYQQAKGYEQTGYLSRDMLVQMSSEAEVRAAQLEAEAKARQEQQEAEDRAYWNQIGRGQDEPGLRAYLDRYPDGLFADVAQERLDRIEAERRETAQGAERTLWDQVSIDGTPAAYQRYLDLYPNGLFAEEAQAQINKLLRVDEREAEREAARREERSVAGNSATRLLVETRLASLGVDPGRIDGNFDKQARRAIRKFQRARGISVTGYVTQETMVRLLAGF